LRANPQIDVVGHGEGEPTFLAVLERFQAAGRDHWDELPSVSFLDRAGQFHSNARSSRLGDLTDLPSPYLAGAFDKMIAENPGQQWLALWETNRGCPFSCTFCDWGGAVGSKVTRFAMDRLTAEIDWFVAHRIRNLFICDANFGMLPRDLDIARTLVERYEHAGIPMAISIQNTKNATERAYQIQKTLTASKLVTFGVTLSMQSVTPRALEAIKRRNISLESFHELGVRYQKDGIETYSDLIVGLPGESYDTFADGLALLLDKGQHNRVAFYNCSVLPNAEMGNPRYQATHGIEYIAVEIIREHENLSRTDRQIVPEFLNTVVATATMNREDWVRTRAFAWLADVLHFDRVLQIVLIVARETSKVGYRDLIEALMDADPQRHPTFTWLRQLFTEHARGIQRGESEFIASEERLGIWWPADQLAVVELVCGGKLPSLYAEALDILSGLFKARGKDVDPALLEAAAALNAGMFRIPSQVEDLEIECSYNILEFYRGVASGIRVPLRRTTSRYRIDRTSTAWTTDAEWCEDVVAQVYRRASFLYPASRMEDEALSGDHAAPSNGALAGEAAVSQ
jgi:Radical SAM superfamily